MKIENTDNFVLDTLKILFDYEISNIIEKTNDAIIVCLADGSKAKIKAIDIA